MSSATSFHMNERTWTLASAVEPRADEFGIEVHTLSNGARVIDAGIHVVGGLAAGRLLVELCMGGFGHVDFLHAVIDGESWPAVQVWTDHPAISCMASQYAGWQIDPEGFFGMGSGPLRALARVERELFEKLRYAEDGSRGVLVLETRTLPDESVAAWIAERSGIRPDGLTLVVAPTASTAGGVQVVARMVETGLHKMSALGFDPLRVRGAMGTAPLAPTAKNDGRAIGRTNDCVLYGGQVHYAIEADDSTLADLASRLPSSTSPDYGTPFYEIFKRYDWDFYKIDALLFSPAEVWLTSTTSGRTFHGGRVNAGVLRASLFE
jgi:methenyltetrahydromethanopterin cyclohydrolase